MNECTRNSWIAAGVMGLLVWVLTAGAGSLGFLSGGFLALLTAGLLAPVLAWLFCAAEPEDDAMTFDRWGVAHGQPGGAGERIVGDAVAGGPMPTGDGAVRPQGDVSIARPSRPAQSSDGAIRLGAPEGASTVATEAVTFTATGAGAQAGRAGGTPAAPAQADGAQDAAAAVSSASAETPTEDTRAIMWDPSESERHDMPGEAVPSSEPEAPPSPRTRGRRKAPLADGGETAHARGKGGGKPAGGGSA